MRRTGLIILENAIFPSLHAWKMQFPKREGALAKVSEMELTAPLPEQFKTIIKGENLKWEPGIQED